MEKIKKDINLKIILLILAQVFLVASAGYMHAETCSLRVPLFSQNKRPIFESLDKLLESEGLDIREVSKAIKKFELSIKSLSRKKLLKGISERNGLIKFVHKGNQVEINIGRDITEFSSLVRLKIPRKKGYHIQALVNPYDRSSFILMFFTDRYAALRFQTGEWKYFTRREYLFIHHPEVNTPSLRAFKDHLWKTYFDDEKRREEYIFSKGEYRERRLRPKPVGYQVGCGAITFMCPKEGKRWEVVRSRIWHIGFMKRSGLWPSALVEVIPGQDATSEGLLFRKKEGPDRYNYLFMLPLSDRALIYSSDGIQEEIYNTGKESKGEINMSDVMTINTFIDRVYWHAGIKWHEKKLGKQRESDDHEAHGHFSIGWPEPEKGGGLFQTHRSEDLKVLLPEGRSEGQSWYPARIVKDENNAEMMRILWLGKAKFGMYITGKGVTPKGRKTLILLNGRYFYLPFIAELLNKNGLVTKDFLDRIGRPGHTKESKAKYKSTKESNKKIYDYKREEWVEVPVIEIEEYTKAPAIPISHNLTGINL